MRLKQAEKEHGLCDHRSWRAKMEMYNDLHISEFLNSQKKAHNKILIEELE